MLWEANTNDFNQIQIENKKIVETFQGWHINNVICPDNKKGREINSLTLTIRKDTNEQRSCETCMHRNEWPHYYCDECCRNWEDNYEKG